MLLLELVYFHLFNLEMVIYENNKNYVLELRLKYTMRKPIYINQEYNAYTVKHL